MCCVILCLLYVCVCVCVQALSDSAGVDGHRVLALLTAYRAAPGELAGAALDDLGPARSVPGPTAYQLTAVRCEPGCPCVPPEQRHIYIRLNNKKAVGLIWIIYLFLCCYSALCPVVYYAETWLSCTYSRINIFWIAYFDPMVVGQNWTNSG